MRYHQGAENSETIRNLFSSGYCYTWLFDISATRDVHLYLEDCNVTAMFVDTGVIVKNRREFANEYFKLESIFR